MLSIKNKILRSLKWTVLSSAIVTLGSVVQLSVLTRVVSQSEFGLWAIANVFIGFAAAFIDVGVGGAIIHKQDITPRQLSTLYWINIFAGVLFYLILLACAPLIAWYYKNPALSAIVALSGLNLLFPTIGIQFKILLQKSFKMDVISKIDVCAFALNFMVSVVLSFRSFGVYALIYGNLAGSLTAALAYFFLGRSLHRPERYFNLREVDFFLRFGSFQLGERLINYAHEQFDVFFIARLCAPAQLGVYDVFKRLIKRPIFLINPIVTKISLPAMAYQQDKGQALGFIFQRSILYLCSINFPIYIFAFVAADPIIRMLFGPAWLEGAPVFRLLCAYFLLYSTGNPVGSLLIAKGKASWGFYWNLAILPLSALFIYAGSRQGITGVAAALLALQVLLIFFNYFFQVKPLINAPAAGYFSNMAKPLSLSLIAGAGAFVAGLLFDSPVEKLIAMAVSGTAVYIVLSFLFNKAFLEEIGGLIRGGASRQPAKPL